MKKIFYLALVMVLFTSWGCNDDSFLDRAPTNILTEDQIWADEGQVLSVLGNLYNRYVDIANFKDFPRTNGLNTIPGWTRLADFNEAFYSEAGQYNVFQNNGWDFNYWSTWDYGYIREINLFTRN